MSNRLMPAAKRTGSTGSRTRAAENAAAPPASTSSATSVAVSKPRPKSRPTGYMCQRLGDRLGHAAEEPVHEAALVELLLQLGLVEVAAAHAPGRPSRSARTTRLIRPMRIRKTPETAVPISPVVAVQRRSVVLDLAGQRPGRRTRAAAHRPKTTRGVAEGEPEADRQRPLALGHQLAGGVVDGGDVVGVEGVPHAEGVGGDAEADAEDLARRRCSAAGPRPPSG